MFINIVVQNASLHKICMYVPGEGKGNTVGTSLSQGEKNSDWPEKSLMAH